MRTLILVLAVLLLAVGCGKKKVTYIYSPDKSQCITIINQNDVRFIIDGKHNKPPKSNFVKLNIQNTEFLGDAVHICWNNSQYEWDVVVHESKLIESRLDTTRFHFETMLPSDDRNIPNERKFRREGCAIFSFYMMKLSPDKGAIVEY